MKRFFSIGLVLMFTICLLTGCATTQNLTSSLTSKVESFTSNVDDQLFSQVPEDERQGIPKAESNLRTADEKLKLADLKGIKKVAFPPMGTGFYGVPLAQSARLMFETITEYLSGDTEIDEVVICLLDNREFKPFQEQLLAVR